MKLPNGNTIACVLHDVLLVPDLTYNLFSVTSASKKGKSDHFLKIKMWSQGCQFGCGVQRRKFMLPWLWWCGISGLPKLQADLLQGKTVTLQIWPLGGSRNARKWNGGRNRFWWEAGVWVLWMMYWRKKQLAAILIFLSAEGLTGFALSTCVYLWNCSPTKSISPMKCDIVPNQISVFFIFWLQCICPCV